MHVLPACTWALQVVGSDLHVTAILGQDNIKSDAADMGVDAEPILEAAGRQKAAPVVVLFNSEHIGGELSGWRHGQGAIQLRKPAAAHVDFTPALARHAAC